MSAPVISVEKLSKRYFISHKAGARGDLRYTLDRALRHPLRWLKERNRTPRDRQEEFWALKDVSFEVRRGEVMGIIGSNGAGKSTLLKILSRITEPTSGRIEIDGRVASLLEVGTGFHPDLTGRENIFLNGAILGMSRLEIKGKFDEIVAFAEVEKFLDTPVKHYSSGMYVRLAFAVAAHLEPEILIVDEVLAVGDAYFQNKCLGKMQDVSKGGRTVLFVSHNMQAVVTLCNAAVWLQGGRLFAAGASRELVSQYIARHAAGSRTKHLPLAEVPRSGSGAAIFTQLAIAPHGPVAEKMKHIITGASVRIDLEIVSKRELKGANVAVTIYDANNVRLIDINTGLKGEFLSLRPGETARVSFVVEELLLKAGRYVVELWLGRGGIEDVDFVKEAGVMEVHDDVADTNHTETFPGVYQCRFHHQIAKFSAAGKLA